MNDPLQQALAESLPVLQRIRDGLGPQPVASQSALERVRALKPIRQAAPPEQPRAEPPRSPAPLPSSLDDPAPWTLDSLRAAALACTKCPHLVQSRSQVVFGTGNPRAELFFVGEAPGAEEDQQGEPFVGRAGQLLTKIIAAMGFSRDDVYIGNVLKCRPDMPAGSTGNRKPRPEEMSTCLPWLEKQIELIQPRAMVALGATALEGLLGSTTPVSKMRGKWLDFRGIPVMATYHPAYLLRNQSISEKRKVWEDMLQVLERLGKPITAKQRGFFTQAGS